MMTIMRTRTKHDLSLQEQLLGGSLCGAQIPQKVPGCIQIHFCKIARCNLICTGFFHFLIRKAEK